jgi:hypothetical protein
LIIIPKDSGVMNRKNPCLAREKRASPFVQSENLGEKSGLWDFSGSNNMRKQLY